MCPYSFGPKWVMIVISTMHSTLLKRGICAMYNNKKRGLALSAEDRMGRKKGKLAQKQRICYQNELYILFCPSRIHFCMAHNIFRMWPPSYLKKNIMGEASGFCETMLYWMIKRFAGPGMGMSYTYIINSEGKSVKKKKNIYFLQIHQ